MSRQTTLYRFALSLQMLLYRRYRLMWKQAYLVALIANADQHLFNHTTTVTQRHIPQLKGCRLDGAAVFTDGPLRIANFENFHNATSVMHANEDAIRVEEVPLDIPVHAPVSRLDDMDIYAGNDIPETQTAPPLYDNWRTLQLTPIH
jgi:hypothetical protein